MSLPLGFANEAAYFSAAVKFLETYSWIYRRANTDCIPALDDMPADFKYYFLQLNNDSLNLFPCIHEPLEGSPEMVQRFRQQLAALTPKQTEPKATVVAATAAKHLPRKVAAKKQHEIAQLAANIHAHCAHKTQLIIDLGSGLGYLSEALLQLKPNYLILGLEADEQRVQTASQRSRELLPQTASNSISYKQLYITADASCRVKIERAAAELAQSKGLTNTLGTTIIGLHACADLSIDAMLLFLAMPQVRCLHIMPCCYHKLSLSEQTEGSCFQNFPLSGALRRAAASELAAACFKRPFMRLACQQTAARWRCEAEAHAEHGSRMYMRGLAAALCEKNELVRLKRVKDELQLPLTLDKLQQHYELQQQQTGTHLSWRRTHEARFVEISGRYPDDVGSRLAEALCCLQTSMQQLCENVVLYDRLCHLKELAAAQQLHVEASYERLFDESVSPRCQVLIAKKL